MAPDVTMDEKVHSDVIEQSRMDEVRDIWMQLSQISLGKSQLGR